LNFEEVFCEMTVPEGEVYSGFRSNEKPVSGVHPIFMGFLSLSILIRAKTAVNATNRIKVL
jgi:hypothetical protein